MGSVEIQRMEMYKSRTDLYNKHLKSWGEAQEEVWDKERIWLFEII